MGGPRDAVRVSATTRVGTRLGAIDVGTNTTRLLAVEVGSAELAEALQDSTAAYVARREGLEPGGGPPVRQGHPGGGGTVGGRVKCLHAHIAHHLVTGDNPAGAAVLTHLAWVDPGTPCV